MRIDESFDPESRHPDTFESSRILLRKSGFLFQAAIEEEVRRRQATHHWKILKSEAPWEAPLTGAGGFIDLILESRGRVIIECKKQDDAQWVFPILDSEREPTRMFRAQWTAWRDEQSPRSGWHSFLMNPMSPVASIGVIEKAGGSQLTMERMTSDLCRSVEAFAIDDLRVSAQDPASQYSKVMIPVIVTNAAIQTCYFDPKDVSLKTGALPAGSGEFNDVQFLRFHKSVAPDHPGAGHKLPDSAATLKYLPRDPARTMQEFYGTKERTVFIVNSEHLIHLLSCLETQRPFAGGYPWETMPGTAT